MMADFGTALSVAQTLFAALECSILKGVFPAIGYKSDLKGLMKTVQTVESVLLDVGNKSILSKKELNYIQRLKDAVYDADDLFDEYLTLAELKHQLKGGKLSEKVHRFFSSRNPLKVAFSMSLDIKKIRKKLNDIADDHAKFGFSIVAQPHRKRMEETYSFVNEGRVVGRENETSEIISKLLDSTKDVSFLTIVGVGGLGKTTLAKLVFSHKRIESEFPVRLWVCVSDQDGDPLDVKDVLFRITQSKRKLFADTCMEYVQRKFQRKLRGKKFLLVLDDIWTEDTLEWEKLRDFLMIGGKGSRIIVTTRSKETAGIIGSDIHELEGLSKKDSLRLFEMTAYKEGSTPPKCVEMSEKIVEKCYNVPLAIKVVGSLLHGKPDKWQEFATSGLAGTSNGLNKIMSILKFGYDQLVPSVKSCFAYCALFPKNYVINKEMMMNLWEAQGYIVPFDEGQSIDSAREEHFSILVQRCFFQDVKDEFGGVESFKMHDLMHDLAQRVLGNELCVTDSRIIPILEPSIRHLYDAREKVSEQGIIKCKIRSYLMVESHYAHFDDESPWLDEIFKNWICLRALAFDFLRVDLLPDTLGCLLHLRYLCLANSFHMKKLPDSIAKLYNLRTLNVSNCQSLKEWPKEFSKLVNLTHLYRDNCERLTCMPAHMSKLTSLRVLTDFVVEDESRSGRHRVGQLKDLNCVNLKGRLVIHFEREFKSAKRNVFEGGCLKDSEHLKDLQIRFTVPSNIRKTDEESRSKEEGVMEILQPHPNLMKFELQEYKGVRIGRWGSVQDNWAAFLPNLVYIKLSNCRWLEQLPSFSTLLYLKSLYLSELKNFEYMEEKTTNSREITFFPSLESLEIRGFVKLKGWWRGDNNNLHCQPVFPLLSQVTIVGCPNFTSFPPCPNIQTLSLRVNNEALRITTGEVHSSSSFNYDDKSGLIADLDLIDYLKSMAPRLLTSLYTSYNSKTISFSEVGEVFKNCSSSLRTLEIQFYNKLTRLCGGLEHLTALRSLTLESCKKLSFKEEEYNTTTGMPWKPLHHNLRSLKLDTLNQVENLPEGMKYLTSLQQLEIKECEKLNDLPEWVGCLQSLRSLQIETCQALKSLPQSMIQLTSLQKLKIYKCRELTYIYDGESYIGMDWPNIEHIPDKYIC